MQEEDPRKLYCLCRRKYDGTFMVACDKCDEWFHGACVGITPSRAKRMEVYVCPLCTTPPPEEEDADGEISLNRSAENKLHSSGGQNPGTSSTPKRKAPDSDRPKPQIVAVPKDDPARKLVRSTLGEALSISYDSSQGHPRPEFRADEIEEALYQMFKSTGNNYRAKYRSLLFNLKDARNTNLRLRLLTGELKAAELCKMDSQDLAPQELSEYRKQREEMSLKQVVIKAPEPAPLLAKNDRIAGPLAVEELSNFLKLAKPEENKSTGLTATDQHPDAFPENGSAESEETHPKTSDQMMKDAEKAAMEERMEATKKRARLDELQLKEEEERRKKKLSAIDRLASEADALPTLGDAKIELPPIPKDEPMVTSDKEKEKKPPAGSSNSNGASLPTSATAPVVWKGFISKKEFEKFAVKGFHVSGGNIEQMLPHTLKVIGRSDLTALAKYLAELDFSTSRKRSIYLLEPQSDEDSFGYISTFEFLRSSSRGGVISVPSNAAIKEAFLIPVPGDAAAPSYCQGSKIRFWGDGKDKLLGVFVTKKKDESAPTSAPTSAPISSKPAASVPTLPAAAASLLSSLPATAGSPDVLRQLLNTLFPNAGSGGPPTLNLNNIPQLPPHLLNALVSVVNNPNILSNPAALLGGLPPGAFPPGFNPAAAFPAVPVGGAAPPPGTGFSFPPNFDLNSLPPNLLNVLQNLNLPGAANFGNSPPPFQPNGTPASTKPSSPPK